ncbi:MAG: hypothetical protein KGJ00_04180 [Bradyrhizobium sp.]|nr:hypothetical protein [Bradyrhizobium sp.]
MKFRIYRILTASLAAMALLLAADQTFAASRGSFHGGTHLGSHRMAGHFRHHRGRQQGAIFLPGYDIGDYGYGYGYGYGPNGQAVLDGTQPLPGDVGNSNAADIPWDWPHRYPPLVAPSARPYVSNCGAETQTVPNAHGGTGEVNIVRCY